MYVAVVPNRQSPPAILLREGYRVNGKVKTRTLANLTHWPKAQLEALTQVLRGESLVPAADRFVTETSVPHGHVEAILGTVKRLGLDTLIVAKRSRERDLVVAMLVERLLHPASKLATTRWWQTTTLAEELGVADAEPEDLYAALDWLRDRQPAIERKLATRHLTEGGLVLYDVSSSYYEGRTCPLARFGHDRDGRTGCPIIIYGVLTDADGRPVAVDVYPGNTGDPTTVPDQVEKLQHRFQLARVVLVGDRGMLTDTKIEHLKTCQGLGWISALKARDIRALVDQGPLQLSLFDQTHLAEITSPEYPGERLMACFNPLLAEERTRKREALLQATEGALTKIQREVARRTQTPLAQAEIGLKAGRVINHWKVAKHFTLSIEDGRFTWVRRAETIQREAELDGIYVIRTSEPTARLSAADTVRSYKRLAQVERAFRCLKGIDLRVRPIYHRLDERVRAHIFLCLLAYYVEWHLRDALKPLLFEDEALPAVRQTRDPVAPAEPSEHVQVKKGTRRTSDGLPLHSFDTLLGALGTRCRNSCRVKDAPRGATFTQLTERTTLQARAFALLEGVGSTGKSA
jgi:hypothetical protein